MRRKERQTSAEAAWSVLRGAPYLHLATTTPDGRPLLRALNGVVVDGAACFHGARRGEKMEAVGRWAVVSAEEQLAVLPSWFHGERRACAASVLYRSAQIEGPLEEVQDPDEKTRVLSALMARLQPEGRHEPLELPRYRATVAEVAVLRVKAEKVAGKQALLQDKTPDFRARVMTGLWGRGAPGDVTAIEAIRETSPDDPAPAFLAGPARLRCALAAEHLPEAVSLLRDQYWNRGVFDDRTLAEAQTGARAWVGATDADGALVATMRAVADGAKHGWIGDVAVRPDWRGKGLGRAVFAMLLDHPAVRGTRRVELRTLDAMAFYAGFGFQAARTEGDRTVMVKRR